MGHKKEHVALNLQQITNVVSGDANDNVDDISIKVFVQYSEKMLDRGLTIFEF